MSSDRQDTAAAVGFAATLAVALGPVGVVVAALAVGLERAWHGDAGQPTTARLRRDRVADHRQWLAEDAAAQRRRHEARQRWLADGADPTTRPTDPTMAQRAGAGVRRAWARTVVAAADFATGFRDGWRHANELRRAGKSPLDAARRPAPANPDHKAPADRQPTPPTGGDTAKPTPPTDPKPDQPGGDDMSAPAQTETNLDVLADLIVRIKAEVDAVTTAVDALSERGQRLKALVQQAYELADAKGAPANTRAALDAAMAVVAQLGQHLGSVSEASTAAADEVGTAREGLRPVEQAQDAIHAVGATGDIVATATAG